SDLSQVEPEGVGSLQIERDAELARAFTGGQLPARAHRYELLGMLADILLHPCYLGQGFLRLAIAIVTRGYRHKPNSTPAIAVEGGKVVQPAAESRQRHIANETFAPHARPAAPPRFAPLRDRLTSAPPRHGRQSRLP